MFARYFTVPKKDKVETLSGGMMRRLVTARSLINRPDLLILDEPTIGLDPQARHMIWQRLEDLKDQGLTILVTTHYMDEASRLCDRLAIMDHGRILVEGEPQELVCRYVGKEIVEVAFPEEQLLGYVRSQDLEHGDLGNRLIIYVHDGQDVYKEISGNYCEEGCNLRLASGRRISQTDRQGFEGMRAIRLSITWRFFRVWRRA